jgi:uncharacterized PurR-regulated membrane protein YhhQ (DUF165 family)
MIYATIFFSSFVMGYKVVAFNDHILCASVFIFPLLFPINDSITEIFGVKVSYLMIGAVILCEFLFGILTYSVALLPSPANWQNQEMYPVLTSGFLHIAIADSTSLAIGFFANAYFLNKWGIKLSGKGFFIRSVGATAIGELVFTISTNLITFHSFDVASISQTTNIIISDYIFKMAYSLIVCIPNAILVSKIKSIFMENKHAYSDNKIMPFHPIAMKYRT